MSEEVLGLGQTNVKTAFCEQNKVASSRPDTGEDSNVRKTRGL